MEAGGVRGADRAVPLGVGGVVAAGAAPARRRAQRARRRARRRRLRPARLLRLRHRHAEPRRASPPAGCATPTSTPPRCARPPAPACSPAATTTTCGMGRIVDLATGFPGYDARIPRSCALLPAMLTPHGYAAYAVGKWHLTPEDEEHLGARRDRWPLGRGFERWYGFFPGETHQFVPALIHDSHHVEPPGTLRGRLPPHRATWSTTPSSAIEDLRNVDVDKPWLLYLATGACHSPHQAPRRVARALPRPLRRRAGTRGARPRSPARRPPACCPTHTELSPRPEWVPAWDDLSDDERRVYARYMEAFAALPLPHRRTSSAGCSTASTRSASSTTRSCVVLSDNGASSEGGPDRLAQRRPGVERAAPHRRGGGRAARRDRRAPHPQQLPVGLDGRRQHAVPPLEARDARGRRRRPADRPLARRHRGARRGPPPVRARHRHRCRRSSTSSASSRRPRSPASSSGRSTA